jgi:hypothetical protein
MDGKVNAQLRGPRLSATPVPQHRHERLTMGAFLEPLAAPGAGLGGVGVDPSE